MRVAISVRQPWAWLIIHGGKDIENRNWPTGRRGRVWIHASKGMTRSEYEEAYHFVEKHKLFDLLPQSLQIPAFDELERGGIIGSVEITDCVEESESPWFVGDYGFVLADPKPFPFAACNGALNFFKPTRPAHHTAHPQQGSGNG